MLQFAHLIGMLVLAFLANAPAHAEGRQFVGSTPCGAEPRQFLGISPRLPCERIDWHLAFGRKHGTFHIRPADRLRNGGSERARVQERGQCEDGDRDLVS